VLLPQGTFQGLQRYYAKKKRLYTWRLEGLKLRFKLGKALWRANLFDSIDQSYLTLWDRSLYPLIKEEYRLIQTGIVRPDNITNKLERHWYDKTVYFENTGIRFEPTEQRKTLDQILDEAITFFVKEHVGVVNDIFDHISIGTGTSEPSSADEDLEAEVLRLPIIENGGYIDYLGHNEQYGLIFPFTQGNDTITESGLHSSNDANTDITYCRNTYSPGLIHTINSDAIGVNIIIQHRAF
jgi:hypothetical protein